MEFNKVVCTDEYATIASLFGISTGKGDAKSAAEKAIDAIRILTSELGICTSPELERLKGADASDIAKRCMATQGRLLNLNCREVRIEDLEAIMVEAIETGIGQAV